MYRTAQAPSKSRGTSLPDRSRFGGGRLQRAGPEPSMVQGRDGHGHDFVLGLMIRNGFFVFLVRP